MRRSSPQNRIWNESGNGGLPGQRGGAWYPRAVCIAALFALSCTAARSGDGRLTAAESCRTVDSVLALSGWRGDIEMTGRVTFDVKQYRVRGRFQLSAEPNGDLVFEFSGNMVLGGHHEDVVLSWYDGELRVLDRERGRLYEGADVDGLIAEGLGEEWNVAELIRMVTARTPDCTRLSSVELSGRAERTRLDGRLDGESFRLDFAGGRLTDASWPVRAAGGSGDRLEVTYTWTPASGAGKAALASTVLFLEGRRWRIKLES